MDFLEQIYEKLGEEGLRKARWQTRIRALGMALQIAFVVLYVALWTLTPLGPKLAERVGGTPGFMPWPSSSGRRSSTSLWTTSPGGWSSGWARTASRFPAGCSIS